MVSDKIYHPLKTFDSVPRFRTRILSVLREWLIDGELLTKMTAQLVRKERYPDERTARDEIIQMITFIIDQYEKMDGLLKEIDRKNASYTRASVERTQYLLNTNRDTKGKLIEIIKALPKLSFDLPENIAQDLHKVTNLFEQSWIDYNSLYREPKKRVFSQPEPLSSDSGVSLEELEAEFIQFKQRINESLSHAKVMAFIENILTNREKVSSSDLELEVTEDLLKLMLSVLKSDEPDVPYRVEFQEGYVIVNGFRIPNLAIAKKGSSADVV